MKMKQTYLLAGALLLAAFGATAQRSSTQLPPAEQDQLKVAKTDTITRMETLSGIFLNPTKKGTFVLDFNQVLTENARLEVKNRAGRIVYKKPVSVAKKETAWRFDLGKLRPDTYQVEVITPDTTYWTKFKVGR
ncbi:hypothetical protein [Pontibacter amylolyticus]|uniref:T9SS type A sorting domain-containing protein n=1 Tax=Pontibacter amylolyticus TaxID=1424080 RepID=A0ABQ1WCN1_9BACT|nr:hypothetical protein [Pontibacter amylolyticus]GGG26317.1 hypothetical protein GCM10011323_32450 [Pontibacter amylolyticus]